VCISWKNKKYLYISLNLFWNIHFKSCSFLLAVVCRSVAAECHEVNSGIFLKQNYLYSPSIILFMSSLTHYLTFCISISQLSLWSVFEKEHIASEAGCFHCQVKELRGTYRVEYVSIISFRGWDWGTRWRSSLRHCATSRKVAGSIPDGIIGVFYWQNPSGRITALGLTDPLTEMSTRHISCGVKAAGA
jgi:hypothetical protein